MIPYRSQRAVLLNAQLLRWMPLVGRFPLIVTLWRSTPPVRESFRLMCGIVAAWPSNPAGTDADQSDPLSKTNN